MNDAIMCAGCLKRPIGKIGLTATTLCARCQGGAKGSGSGRKRRGAELRVCLSGSVDTVTASAFKDADVRVGEVLDAFVAATNGKPTLDALTRLL